MSGIGDEELRTFAQRFSELAAQAHQLLTAGDGATISERVLAHLGVADDDVVITGQTLPVVERPNLQLAIDDLVGTEGQLLGLPAELAHYGGFSVATLIGGTFRGPSHPAPPITDEIPAGVDSELGCVRAAIWLADFEEHPVAIAVHPGERHGPGPGDMRVELLATDQTVVDDVRAALDERRRRHNVYRGQVLGFTFSEYGEFGVHFLHRPTTPADEVILPTGVLSSIHRHTVEMANHADALREAGQHLTRGLLLHGPPGTGKTHTIGHLLAAMPERTTIVLQGNSLGALGHAAAIARNLPPSMLIIEDVDLIATERSMHPMGGGGLMFQLLNEMDGLATSDDIIFVLTTNRVDLLEPALAARPGRIDHAVEIGLPNAGSRHRLFELYFANVDTDIANFADAVERTEGATGAFIKEVARRAVTASLLDGAPLVNQTHLLDAVEQLLASVSPIQAAMLGGPGAGTPKAASDPPLAPPFM